MVRGGVFGHPHGLNRYLVLGIFAVTLAGAMIFWWLAIVQPDPALVGVFATLAWIFLATLVCLPFFVLALGLRKPQNR